MDKVPSLGLSRNMVQMFSYHTEDPEQDRVMPVKRAGERGKGGMMETRNEEIGEAAYVDSQG